MDYKNHWFSPVTKENSKACLLKWSQVSLYLWENGSSSCHRNVNADILEDFDFHNTEIVKQHRSKMLNGDWPSDGRGCEHCRDQELAGGVSDRMQWLNQESNKRYIPIELKQDPYATIVQPTQLSIHFNNKCNLKCVYCGPTLSSAWVNEVVKYNEQSYWKITNLDEIEGTYKKRVEKFYEWMEKNYKNLKAFDILGGEPLIQQETFDCIDWMIEHPNPEVDFEIYSNMQVKPMLFRRQMEKIRKLAGTVREVLFVASIDCAGPQSEFIRFGHDWDTFEENFEYLLKECPEVVPTMNWSVSVLSIPYTADLVRKVLDWSKIRPIRVNYNKVHHPYHLSPSIMPKGFYTPYFEEINELNLLLYQNNKGYIDYVNGIFNEIDSTESNITHLISLKDFMDKMDDRRGTNWRSLFPWLEEVFNETLKDLQ